MNYTNAYLELIEKKIEDVIGSNEELKKIAARKSKFVDKQDLTDSLDSLRKEVISNIKLPEIALPKVMDGKDGKDGEDGKDGSDGVTPVKGKDYFTKEEINDIKDQIVKSVKSKTKIDYSEVDSAIEKQLNEFSEEFVDYIIKQVSQTPEDIRDALETLEGDNRLDASAIKNLPTQAALITGGSSAGGGTSNHADLTNLNWSTAGHTIDTDLDFDGNTAANLADPVNADDAATKGYVDLNFINDFDYVDVVYVGKHGDDVNDGLSPENAVLTLNRAEVVAESLTTGTNRVVIKILDAGTYSTGNWTVDDNNDIFAPSATVDARLVIRDSVNVDLYRLVDDGSAFPTINKNSGDQNAYVRIKEIDMRGIDGTNTGGVGIRNQGGGGIIVVNADKLYVCADGVGIGDQATGFGHCHLQVEDLYMAGNNAVAIQSLNSNASIIVRAGHILKLGTPTDTTAIDGSISGSEIFVITNQVVADTAITVANGAKVYIQSTEIEGDITVANGGELYINCESFSGTLTNNGKIQGRIGNTIYDDTTVQGKMTASEDIEVTSAASGLILKSPNGTRWRVTVDDSGNLSTASI